MLDIGVRFCFGDSTCVRVIIRVKLMQSAATPSHIVRLTEAILDNLAIL